MWDFRLGSDSYCLCVIFRADTGSLWHTMKHMDGTAFFLLQAGLCVRVHTCTETFVDTVKCIVIVGELKNMSEKNTFICGLTELTLRPYYFCQFNNNSYWCVE